MLRRALLRGRDQQQLGGLATVCEGDAAIALSRGGAPKRYPHVDANEDAALFASGAGGVLLAVADGHDGALGAESALECLGSEIAEAWCAEAPPCARPEGCCELAWAAAQRASLAVCEACERECLPVAPTTLAVALARPAENRLLVLSVGDSHVFALRGRDGGVDDLSRGQDDAAQRFFLGTPRETWHRDAARIVVLPLAGIDALVLATDGLSEVGIGFDDPPRAVADACRDARGIERPRRAQWLAREVTARAIAEHRRRASGDNVATAVLWTRSRD